MNWCFDLDLFAYTSSIIQYDVFAMRGIDIFILMCI